MSTPDPGLNSVLCRFTVVHDLIGALCSEDIRSLLCVGCLNRDKEARGGANCQAPLHSVARVDGVATERRKGQGSGRWLEVGGDGPLELGHPCGPSGRTMSDGNDYSSIVWDGVSDQYHKITDKIALTKHYKTLRQPGCIPLP